MTFLWFRKERQDNINSRYYHLQSWNGFPTNHVCMCVRLRILASQWSLGTSGNQHTKKHVENSTRRVNTDNWIVASYAYLVTKCKTNNTRHIWLNQEIVLEARTMSRLSAKAQIRTAISRVKYDAKKISRAMNRGAAPERYLLLRSTQELRGG